MLARAAADAGPVLHRKAHPLQKLQLKLKAASATRSQQPNWGAQDLNPICGQLLGGVAVLIRFLASVAAHAEAGVHLGAQTPAMVAIKVSLGGESTGLQPSRGVQDLNPIDGRLLDEVLLRSVELLPTLTLEFIEELTHCIGRNHYRIGAVGRSQLMVIGRHVLQKACTPVFQHGIVRVAGLWTATIGTLGHVNVLNI